jgi:hypothetical protein
MKLRLEMQKHLLLKAFPTSDAVILLSRTKVLLGGIG